ncbi:Glycosyltransferase Family 4 protein [Gigaspora rosea]|uniref:Glycosyltransferase Family 4 protein n=1 Tax=Gigaspora rosea TaxID=44941 RepID=A0A397VNV9_9GLOM|nr:Glycosyltransferase Family 4 protein [Gigaspora rosea]
MPLVYTTNKRSFEAGLPQAIYLGLEIDYNGETDEVEYSICTNDGNYSMDFEVSSIDVSDITKREGHKDVEYIERITTVIFEKIRNYALTQNCKIHAIGLGARINSTGLLNGRKAKALLFEAPGLASRLWLEYDILPFIIGTRGKGIDERANSAIRKAVIWLSPQFPGSIPRVSVGFRHEVEVDLNGKIKLVDLSHYENTVCPKTWSILSKIVGQLKSKRVKASFFNATPQGGGVALMRHALIRLCRLLKLDIHWFVAKPKPEIFDITKRKFHNILQGVGPSDTRLTQDDKNAFLTWSENNVERFWGDEDGPIKTSDVVIIDDPQVCGIIPHIKRLNPTCKIIYRSHIEICADLIRNDPNGPQAEVWDFLWGFISQADLFVSHPIANFVPDNIPREKVVLLPASTDPLDGLNKELSQTDLNYYKMVYNRLSIDQCGVVIDFNRPYVIQIARFDPSKGIPLVIESFKIFRDKLKKEGWPSEKLPSLIICGASSIDDPDGIPIHEQTCELLSHSEYAGIADDVSVVRLPACDQIFNTMLSCARVVLQLSTREGFEVKVTEALAKGIPVVAFKAGGIPLQINHEKTGFLANIGDTAQVANYLFALFTNDELYNNMSFSARSNLNEEYFTVFQTLNWLYLIDTFASIKKKSLKNNNDDVLVGNYKWVKELWANQHGSHL